jgi:2-methylcitrate dehydratase PrpD
VPAERSEAGEPVEAKLAAYAADVDRAAIGPEAEAAFDRLALDFVSVVIAGLRDPACVRAANALGGLSDFGANASASAFALGVCAHWFDWDDTDDVSHVHGGAVIFPTLLAASASQAKPARVPGEHFVAATVAGYDIACSIGGHLKDHGHRGWMPTGSGGTIGAAAAAARLAGARAEQVLSAMGIAAANAALGRQALADRKNLKGALAGIAAKTATDALALSRSGIEGSVRYLSGAYGLCAMQAGDVPMDASRLGREFLIERTSVKPYPCCRSAHAVIDGVLEFRESSPARIAEVASIEVSAPPGVFERCGAAFRIGDNARLSAQFSIPYTAALALRKGRVGLDDFTDREVTRNHRDWHALIDSVRVGCDPKWSADVLAPVHLRFRSADRVIDEREVSALKGDPKSPLSAAEQEAKLRDAAGTAFDETRIAEIAALARNLRRDGPGELLRWLGPQLAARAAGSAP